MNSLPIFRRRFVRPTFAALLAATAARAALTAEAESAAKPPASPEIRIPAPYSFKVGNLDCTVLGDALIRYDCRSIFANAPETELGRALAQWGGSGNQLTLPYAALLVRTPTHTVLIDTGAGSSPIPGAGHLMSSLAAAGVSPAQIDTVILTHGHLDHIGGTLRADGTPAFPCARYVMSRAEWDFWAQEKPDLSAVPFDAGSWTQIAHAQLRPLRDRMELVDHESEIRPGITALLAPGHTPGLMLVQIESEGRKLLCLSDLALSPITLEHPTWRPAYDLNPAAAQATLRHFLARAAQNHPLIYATHFPWPGLGTVATAGDHWVWQPEVAAH